MEQNNTDLTISSKLQMFCVLYVDIERSTLGAAQIRPDKYLMYYRTFYDVLSGIAKKYGGKVIKHIGDALLIYFPATSDPSNKDAFRSMLDCAAVMLQDARIAINKAFHQEQIPKLSYRISADYGRMEPIETETSISIDWVGPSMNMVSKMNHLAEPNTMVIGGDLHQVVSRFYFHEYEFHRTGELDIGIKQKYPIFRVAKSSTPARFESGLEISGINVAENRKNDKETPNPKSCYIPNIFIVDDENDVLLVYKQFLAGQNVNVEVFNDPLLLFGRLAVVGPTYFDLGIIDIRLPTINGIQLYQILTSLKPNIKALFLSALDCVGDILISLQEIGKETDYIRKPVGREALIRAVNQKIELLS